MKGSWTAYHRITRTATYGFLAALPLLLLYEAMILLANQGRAAQVRVGAEVWMKYLLTAFGMTGLLVLGGVVLLVGAAIFYTERKKHIPIRPRYFGWLIGESALYGILLAFLVSGMVGMLFAAAPIYAHALLVPPPLLSDSLLTNLALSIGAGLYEELLFRVVVVGGLFALLRSVFFDETYAYLFAAVVGALLFSAVHYIGALGDAFTPASFTYRFLFGLALNAVYLVRGFGVAAWTHALYDVMVVTRLLG